MNDSFSSADSLDPETGFGAKLVFVRRTYQILLLNVLAMLGLGLVSHAFLPRPALAPLSLADGLIWVLCGWFGWRQPLGLVFALFTVTTGLLLGQLAWLYPASFFAASLLAPLAFAGLSLYVLATRKSFSFLHGFLTAGFFILLGGMVLQIFFHSAWVELAITGFGTLVFAAWILYDTSQILERRDAEFAPALAAFELIMDLVGLHRWLMDLFESEK